MLPGGMKMRYNHLGWKLGGGTNDWKGSVLVQKRCIWFSAKHGSEKEHWRLKINEGLSREHSL